MSSSTEVERKKPKTQVCVVLYNLSVFIKIIEEATKKMAKYGDDVEIYSLRPILSDLV